MEGVTEDPPHPLFQTHSYKTLEVLQNPCSRCAVPWLPCTKKKKSEPKISQTLGISKFPLKSALNQQPKPQPAAEQLTPAPCDLS